MLSSADYVNESACEQHREHAQRYLCLEVRNIRFFLFIHHAEVDKGCGHKDYGKAEQTDKRGADVRPQGSSAEQYHNDKQNSQNRV